MKKVRRMLDLPSKEAAREVAEEMLKEIMHPDSGERAIMEAYPLGPHNRGTEHDGDPEESVEALAEGDRRMDENLDFFLDSFDQAMKLFKESS
ncbi:MAG: hypothetical protein WAV21_01735 [Minisyncoccia bacterium]